MPAPFQKKNKSNRGVAQVVAHQTGGLGVASSSLVTPTKKELRNSEALFYPSRRLGISSRVGVYIIAVGAYHQPKAVLPAA